MTARAMRAVFPGHKRGNQYAELLGAAYNDMPKALLAAIAVSFAARLEDDSLDKAGALVLEEWRALYQNGVVSQRPDK